MVINEILSGAYSCYQCCLVEVEAEVEVERCLAVRDVELFCVFVGRERLVGEG